MTQHLHERRKISFAELGALLGTRALIERHLVTPTTDRHPYKDDHYINMGVACRRAGECGSVGCIGGTMGLLMGKNVDDAHNYVMRHHTDKYVPGSLGELFFPPIEPDDYERITPAQMIKAIDNFIDRGRPYWKAVFTAVKD